MDKIDLPSGAVLEIGLLPYEDAWKVQQKVAAVFETLKIDIEKIDLKNLFATDIMAIKGPIMHLLSNEVIIAAAKDCFKKCLYNGLKIDVLTFDSKEARGDYLYCVFHVLKANIEPFFAGLVSFLSAK